MKLQSAGWDPKEKVDSELSERGMKLRDDSANPLDEKKKDDRAAVPAVSGIHRGEGVDTEEMVPIKIRVEPEVLGNFYTCDAEILKAGKGALQPELELPRFHLDRDRRPPVT